MRNLTLSEVIQVVGENERQKRDFLVETNNLSVKTENGTCHLNVPIGRKVESFALNDTARTQLAERLDIPYRFAEHLREEHPALLDNALNTLFGAHPEKRLVRTLGDKCRAILSPRYRILDYYSFFGAVLPMLAELPDAEVQECLLTDTHLRLSIVLQKTSMFVRQGDIVSYGISLTSSECGLGSLSVSAYVMRKVCSNGLVVSQGDGPALRRYHLGKRIEDLSRLPSDREIWLSYQDYIREVADRNKFPELVRRMQAATQTPVIDDPVDAVEEIAKRFQIAKEESERILQLYQASDDRSLWGLVNAITEEAKNAATVQRKVELQTIGGKLLPSDNGSLFLEAV